MVQQAIEAVKLAQLGITSSRDIFEGKYGFLTTFSGEKEIAIKQKIGDVSEFTLASFQAEMVQRTNIQQLMKAGSS